MKSFKNAVNLTEGIYTLAPGIHPALAMKDAQDHINGEIDYWWEEGPGEDDWGHITSTEHVRFSPRYGCFIYNAQSSDMTPWKKKDGAIIKKFLGQIGKELVVATARGIDELKSMPQLKKMKLDWKKEEKEADAMVKTNKRTLLQVKAIRENDFEEDDMGSSGWKPDKLALKYYSER